MLVNGNITEVNVIGIYQISEKQFSRVLQISYVDIDTFTLSSDVETNQLGSPPFPLLGKGRSFKTAGSILYSSENAENT